MFPFLRSASVRKNAGESAIGYSNCSQRRHVWSNIFECCSSTKMRMPNFRFCMILNGKKILFPPLVSNNNNAIFIYASNYVCHVCSSTRFHNFMCVIFLLNPVVEPCDSWNLDARLRAHTSTPKCWQGYLRNGETRGNVQGVFITLY